MKKNPVNAIEEKELNAPNGLAMAFLTVIIYIAAIAGTIIGGSENTTYSGLLMVISLIWLFVGWIPFLGIKVIRPNEALVLTLFGKYTGTLKKEGIFYVDPFSTAVNPAVSAEAPATVSVSENKTEVKAAQTFSKKLSLKAMTLNNRK